jgi:1-acyl-sn-glycerol-3-phosphate acyltransferase
MKILKSILVWFAGILFMVVLFPVTFIIWLLALPFDRNRIVIHRLLLAQSNLITRLIWKINIEGKEKSKRGTAYVIISNHQSLADILVINCLGYDFKWISKIENIKLPVLGWYLKMAGYITVDRGDEASKAEMLVRSFKSLKNGNSIMIFPEGTRSHNGQPGFFKRGAFQLAIEAGVPILPIVIDGTGDILPKHGLILKANHNIRLQVLDPVPPSLFGTANPEELAARFRDLTVAALKELRAKSFQR